MRLQHVPERGGMARRDLGYERDRAERVALVLLVAGELGEAQQADGCAGGAGGDGGVLEVLAPDDQRFAVCGGREETALLGVGEAGDHLVGQRHGLVKPALLAGGFEQRDQRLQQEGVVLEVGVDLGLAVVVGAQQAAATVAHLALQELGAGDCGVQVASRRRRVRRRRLRGC